MSYGKWRPFVHVMGGIQRTKSGDNTYHPAAFDIGGGVDRKLPFKTFSWRLQFDLVPTHLLRQTQKEYRVSTGIVWSVSAHSSLLFKRTSLAEPSSLYTGLWS